MKTTKTIQTNTNKIAVLPTITAIALGFAVQAVAQTTYLGNGATGFGGPVGTGSLTVSDTASSLTFTLNRGAGAMNDDLVLYLDTQSGGFPDTTAFQDNADGGRTAISGFNAGNPSQTVATFATAGLLPDYAVSIENSFIGVFQLVPGGNGSLNYLFGQGQSGNNLDSSYSITLNAAQMSQIGLTAGSGQTFNFVGSLISSTAYRANETIGASITVPGDGAGNAGFNNPQTFLGADSYTLQTVPEPASLALFGLSGLMTSLLIRRRK